MPRKQRFAQFYGMERIKYRAIRLACAWEWHIANLPFGYHGAHNPVISAVLLHCDKESGTKNERLGWQQLMDYIREGDVLVITELSRMTRSLKQMLQVVEDLDNKGVGIISMQEHIDTSTATGRCFVSIMGAISQMERELKSERAAAGREAAKARGKTGGRPRTDLKKLEQARILYENSNQTASEVCLAVGIGRRTLFSYIAQRQKNIERNI